jgi:hypothetical protein
MSPDLAALTGSVVVGLPEVQACLLLTRDGLPLASYPRERERAATQAWARWAALGEVRRGFAVLEGEMWLYAKDAGHAAFVLARPDARPGLILERLDRMLEELAHHELAPIARSETRPEPFEEEPPPQLREEPEEVRIALTITPDPEPVAPPEPAPVATEARTGGEHDEAIDTVALAREFAGLIPQEEAG